MEPIIAVTGCSALKRNRVGLSDEKSLRTACRSESARECVAQTCKRPSDSSDHDRQQTKSRRAQVIGCSDEGKTWAAHRKPSADQCQCGKQAEGISKMHAQKESVSGGLAQATKVIDQDEQGTEETRIEQVHSCGHSRVTRPVSFGSATLAPNQKSGHQHERHAARYSVREFDHGVSLRSRGENFAVAERPTTAATFS